MKLNRRAFLGVSTGVAASTLSGIPTPQNAIGGVPEKAAATPTVTDEQLRQAADRPVLRLDRLKSPVVIETVELLRKGREHFVRVRSKDGAEGISVDDGRMDVLHPILNRLVIPYFIGKDARDLEEHLFGVYRHESNYKLQGLALWCPVALVAFAILDMLGRMLKKPMGQLLGNLV